MENKKRSKFIGMVIVLVLFVISAVLFIFNGDNYKDFKQEVAIPQNIVNKGVPIAMALDDNYVYPTVVAITSAMENKNPRSEYSFYVMHPSEFKDESKEKIKSLEKKYNKCHIHFINMGEQFKNANDKGHITTPTYYRLALSDLLVNLDKIIWLDGDTLTFQDLNQMYNIDMEGLYYRGHLDNNANGASSFGVKPGHYICAGVMLINLKELRKDDMANKFNSFIEENNSRLIQHDQTVINVVCADKIGVLPPKFGLFNIYAQEDKILEYARVLVGDDKYTAEELKEALNDICVLHCVTKPWKERSVYLADLWWNYAEKTDFYEEIKETYKF